MTKQVIGFSLIAFLLCTVALAQKKPDAPTPKCSLTLEQSPQLRGLRMGMTQAAVLVQFPGITVEKPDKFGLARLRITLVDASGVIKTSIKEKAVQPDITGGPDAGSAFVVDPSRFPALKGIRKIQIRFINARLAYLEVGYDDQVSWDSLDQFVDTISSTLKLPNQWQTPPDSDGQAKELRCEGFTISANMAGDPNDVHLGPELILQDVAAWDAMSKRQNEVVEKNKRDEDAKRKSFKP